MKLESLKFKITTDEGKGLTREGSQPDRGVSE